MSPDHTLVEESSRQLPLVRKLLLLLVLCFAQFLDAFSMSTILVAVPVLERSMGMTASQGVWIVSGNQLTFASTLLVSGRISDVYGPRLPFIGGVTALGLLSLGAGFVNNKLALIVLRSLSGIACAMSIPSALTLIVRVFPDPAEQARAIGIFGGCGAVADVLGFIIGAIFVQLASYRWIFWFVGMVSLVVGLSSAFVVPAHLAKARQDHEKSVPNWRDLDVVGVAILTVSLILFIFAVTTGSARGWTTLMVLIPLIVSMLLTIAFFFWEALLPVEKAAVPPYMWFYKNFSVLLIVALFPFLWWTVIYTIFMKLWQDVFHWSAISAVAHTLPLGIIAFATSFTGFLTRMFNPKWIILLGLFMASAGTTTLALAGGEPDNYGPFVFPAFLVGSAGTMLAFTHTNIAIFQTAPTSMAGTVGAMFNGALQLGSAIGLAAAISIEMSVEVIHEGPTKYHGRAAALWFILGIIATEVISVMWFYHKTTNQPALHSEDIAKDSGCSLGKGRIDKDEMEATTEHSV
ncbi:major facilitator superfamily domain-containing protein [Scleroderma yunnanense]